MTQQQQVAFEDWEAEINEEENLTAHQQLENIQYNSKAQELPVDIDSTRTFGFIQQLRNLTDKEFEISCRNSATVERVIGESPALLKTEKDFIELSKNVAYRLKKQANDDPDKTVPENNIVLFFEEMLLYLYPKYDWQNLEYAKEKLKIVKKDRKQDENRARKLKQKQERLRRGQKKTESNQDECTNYDKIEKTAKEIKTQTRFQQQYM